MTAPATNNIGTNRPTLTLLGPNPVIDDGIAKNITERAMTVHLRLSAWLGQKVDHKVTAEVIEERKTEKDSGRWDKYLVPKSALEAVQKAHTAARQRHYTLTLPWGDGGARILSATAFTDYSMAMQEERSKCELAYEAFLLQYPGLVANAPTRLGVMYNQKDFPSLDEMRLKFGFKLQTLPVPDQDDFRVDLSAEAADAIRQSITDTVTEQAAEAQRELWQRLFDTVKHFAQTMGTEKKLFRNTTVTKLRDLARIAPKLSLKPDPQLEAICAEVLDLVSDTSPEELRENEDLRFARARQAREAVKQIEDAMAGVY